MDRLDAMRVFVDVADRGSQVAAAEALGHSHMPVVSGAGHDAVYMARLAPTGMIFVPCKDGISHNEIENATPSDLAALCMALLARDPGERPGDDEILAGAAGEGDREMHDVVGPQLDRIADQQRHDGPPCSSRSSISGACRLSFECPRA